MNAPIASGVKEKWIETYGCRILSEWKKTKTEGLRKREKANVDLTVEILTCYC